MKLIFGYDIVTYNGEIPNCLHPKFLNTIYEASDFDYSMSGEHFQKRWNMGWHIYNSNFWNDYIEKKSVFDIVKNHKDKNWFYPVEPFGSIESFFGNGGLLFNEFTLNQISNVALNEIKNGNANLLINYIVDGGLGMTKANFTKLINFTKENDIPDEKVYLIFQDFKLKKNLENLGMKYNVIDFNLAHLSKSQEFNNILNNPDFRFWGDNAHEPQVGRTKSSKNSILTNDEFVNNIGSERVDYLYLCRHWKLHRLMILSKLHKMGKLFTDNVSWDKRFYHQDVIDEFQKHDNNIELSNILKATSRHLDYDDLTKIAGYGFENKEIYQTSYLSLVSESIFFQYKEESDVLVDFPSGYLSEKIWKAIGHSHPFILIGPAKSLEYLHNMGYKSFHPFIDESYDIETHDFKRLELINREIEKFSNKSKEEKDQFLIDVKDILKHNQNLFLDYSKGKHKDDCLKVIKEISRNII